MNKCINIGRERWRGMKGEIGWKHCTTAFSSTASVFMLCAEHKNTWLGQRFGWITGEKKFTLALNSLSNLTTKRAHQNTVFSQRKNLLYRKTLSSRPVLCHWRVVLGWQSIDFLFKIPQIIFGLFRIYGFIYSLADICTWRLVLIKLSCATCIVFLDLTMNPYHGL